MNVDQELKQAQRQVIQAAQDAPARPPAPVSRPGSYDYAKRRKAKRQGREKGCWAYIPADELTKAGFDPDGPPPFYRVWGSSRGGLFVRLYREA